MPDQPPPPQPPEPPPPPPQPPPPPPPQPQPQPPPPPQPHKDDDKSTIRIVAISIAAVVVTLGLIILALRSCAENVSELGENVVEEGAQIAAGSSGAAEGFAEVKIPKRATNVETRVEAGQAVDGLKVWISFEVAPGQTEEFLRKEKIDGLRPAPPAVLEGLLKDACAGAPASVALCPGWRSVAVKDGLGAGRTGQQAIGQLRRPLDMVVVSRESPRSTAIYLRAAL
jgi:hypothetical protein